MAADMQKKIFMSGEGDAWFQRNHGALENRTFDGDPIVKACQNILASKLRGGGGITRSRLRRWAKACVDARACWPGVS